MLEASLDAMRDPLFANSRDHSVCTDGKPGHAPTETVGDSHIKWFERGRELQMESTVINANSYLPLR